MPRSKGLGRHGTGKRNTGKPLTNNAAQAAARDERAAAAAEEFAAFVEEAARAEKEALRADEEALRAEAQRQRTMKPAHVPSNGEWAAFKRQSIVFHYFELDCPPVSEWGKSGGTLRQIADALGMPDPCDYRPIRETLTRFLAGEDVWHTKGGQGAKPMLPYGEQCVAAELLRTGMGQEQAAHVLTQWREDKGMSKEEAEVGRTAVRTGFFKGLGGVHNHRGTTCTGNRDPDSAWATSSLAQAEQWKEQIQTPEEVEAASAPGPTLNVDGKRIKTLAMDPLSLLGKNVVIKVLGSTWPNQSKADAKKKWPCEIVGYTNPYTYGDGGVEAAYRKGRRRTRTYIPPYIQAVVDDWRERFERLDPQTAHLPPKKRRRRPEGAD